MNFFTCIANYFLLVIRIIFTTGTENYFFIGAENYFSRYCEFIFWPTIPCGLAVEGDWLGCLTFGQYKTWTADYGLRTTDWV